MLNDDYADHADNKDADVIYATIYNPLLLTSSKDCISAAPQISSMCRTVIFSNINVGLYCA